MIHVWYACSSVSLDYVHLGYLLLEKLTRLFWDEGFLIFFCSDLLFLPSVS